MDNIKKRHYYKCPHCKEILSDTDEICPFCKYDLYPEDNTKSLIDNFIISGLIIISYYIACLLIDLGHLKDFLHSEIINNIFFLSLILSITVSVFTMTVLIRKKLTLEITIYYALSFSIVIIYIFPSNTTKLIVHFNPIILICVIIFSSWVIINIIPINIYTIINNIVKKNLSHQKVLKAITTIIIISTALSFGLSIFAFHKHYKGLSELYNKKEASYTAMINKDHNNAKAYKKKGFKRYKKKDYEGALEYYNESISLNPEDAETYIIRAIVYKDLKNLEEALNDYNKAEKLDKKLVKKYAKKYKDMKSSIERYKKKIKKQKVTKSSIERYKKKIKKFTDKINLDPNNEESYIKRAEAKSEMKDYSGAIEDYTQAIKLQSGKLEYKKTDNSNILSPELAYYYSSNSLIRLYCSRAQAKSNLSQYKKAIEDCTEALDIFNKALEVYPKGKYDNYRADSTIYRRMALSKTQLGDYQGAIEDYETLLEINPDEKRYVEKKMKHLKQLQK